MNQVSFINLYGDPNNGFLARGGGINIYSLNLAKALLRRQVRVALFSPDYPGKGTPSLVGGSVYLDLGVARMSKGYLADNMEKIVGASGRYLRQLGQSKAVYTHYWLSGWYWHLLRGRHPALKRIPWFHSFHSLGRVRGQHVDDASLRHRVRVEDQLIRAADTLLLNSASERADLGSLYAPTPKRVAILHGGYPEEMFTDAPCTVLHQRLGLPPTQKIVLFLGRFEKRKGVFGFVSVAKALARLPGVVFAMVGGRQDFGYERAAYQAVLSKIEHDGLRNIRLLPPVAHGQLHEIYRSCFAILLPSMYEPFGMTALEAQACGCIPIGADVGGLSCTIKHGYSGYLTDNTTAAYARYLEKLLADPPLAAQMRQNSVRWVKERFTWDSAAKKFKQMLLAHGHKR